MKEGNVFPRDRDTLCIITEIEAYLGLRNKDVDKISYTELIEYIDQITLMLINNLSVSKSVSLIKNLGS